MTYIESTVRSGQKVFIFTPEPLLVVNSQKPDTIICWTKKGFSSTILTTQDRTRVFVGNTLKHFVQRLLRGFRTSQTETLEIEPKDFNGTVVSVPRGVTIRVCNARHITVSSSLDSTVTVD